MDPSLLTQSLCQHNQQALASAAWLVYDFLITLDDEVELVWKSPNTLPKCLYFVSRYVGLFGQVYALLFTSMWAEPPDLISASFLGSNALPPFCFAGLVLSFVFLGILLASVEIGMMIRVDALYNKSHYIRIVMGLAFAANHIPALVLGGLSLRTLRTGTIPISTFIDRPGCLAVVDPIYYKYAMLPTLVFETIMFGLNTWKCIQHRPFYPSALIFLLWRDGSVYYFVMLANLSILTLANFVPTFPIAPFVIVWAFAVISFSGSHLLLNVRKAAVTRRPRSLPTIHLSTPVPFAATATRHRSDALEGSVLDSTTAAAPPSSPCSAAHALSADGDWDHDPHDWFAGWQEEYWGDGAAIEMAPVRGHTVAQSGRRLSPAPDRR
ncbi:uncharacterized protein BXZ73DRAFT_100473 [Epithele typhae]|uniref:uncharacterized protein n=1 Tax=Epithele typhae TaxID=378194 RepID=UPI002008280C|nr:uncharacterized protein BXZ73DRAFT_100473 [Epithele typhae]KAH9935999.1 hypothetical protein BXZ73DRAFT_100473 [Epithele typhae]